MGRKTTTIMGIVAAVMLSACSCHFTAITPGTTPTATPAPIASATAGPSTTMVFDLKGTVETVGSGCNDDTTRGGTQGDCWLPLYSQPSFIGTVLNATNGPSTCPLKGDESGCWPQPGDTVDVLCMMRDGHNTYYFGINVPPDRQLTPDATAIKTPLGGVYGYNKKMWVSTSNATIPDCPKR